MSAYYTHIKPATSVFWESRLILSSLESMAGTTGLEPATSAVTGQRSDQLSYVPLQRRTHSFEAIRLLSQYA